MPRSKGMSPSGFSIWGRSSDNTSTLVRRRSGFLAHAPVMPGHSGEASAPASLARRMLNKVPEITLYFWIIKVLCTTVGETAADFLNDNSVRADQHDVRDVGGARRRARLPVPAAPLRARRLLARGRADQRRRHADHRQPDRQLRRVAGTTTIVFSVALAATFAAWYASERTLSIHTIVTTRREAFYWLAVLFTFALGTAAGDLTAERLAVGYWQSALIFGAMIAAVYVAHVRFALNAVLAFWLAYILTRPLGASIGDYLSQPTRRRRARPGDDRDERRVPVRDPRRRRLPDGDEAGRDRVEPRRRRGREPRRPCARARRREQDVCDPALVEAVRERASAGPADFVMLVPNPAHLAFDRVELGHREGEQLLAEALPLSSRPPGPRSRAASRRAPTPSTTSSRSSSGAALQRDHPRDAPESRLALAPRRPAQRLAHLGYPLTTVTATH